MADSTDVQYSSYADDDDEDYEYSYSDEDEDQNNSYGDEGDDDIEAMDVVSASSSRRSSKNIANPNAAPMSGSDRQDTTCSMDSDLGVLGSNPDAVRMIDSADLFPVMKRRLRSVIEVLSIPESAAAVLMREHKWAKERLFDSFCTDPEKVQEKCGVRARCSSASASGAGSKPTAGKSRIKNSSRKGLRECGICCEDNIQPANMLGMPCGHEFCRDCWKGFIACAVADGPNCVRTVCPQVGCGEVVTEDEVAVVAPECLAKFKLYQLRSFVETDEKSRWCPGPGCTRVAVASSAGCTGVAECDCGSIFCLRCGEEPHAPSTCAELARWREKCKNESETANWILANTKACPKCSSRIEKNQGCNHMSCQQCKHEFCWICLASWSEHGANTGGYYKCNKYDPNSASDDQSDAAKAKRELDRYLHYYKRYHAHSVAQKFAQKQLQETEARMVLLQESTDNSTWSDVEFLKTATEQLVECRRVLKYTYTFAYYLADSTKKKERFEHHQEMLEKFTENLSELSEMPLAEMDRTDIVNQTRVVNRFMKNILTYVEDGMEED